ncbi:MAG: hypothetical protein ACK6D7_07850 [Acidobacteriota bacterium]
MPRTVIDQELDAAHVELGGFGQREGAGDRLGRWLLALNAQLLLAWGVHRAGGDLLRHLADVGRAEVEARQVGPDADGVEKLAVEDFNAYDGLPARREKLLQQRRAVHAKVEGGGGELVERVEAHDAGPAAADVGFKNNRERQRAGRFEHAARVVHHNGARVAHAAAAEQVELPRLRDLNGVGGAAVDHRDAVLLKMPEVVPHQEDAVAVAAAVRGRAHAVDDEVERGRGGRVVEQGVGREL